MSDTQSDPDNTAQALTERIEGEAACVIGGETAKTMSELKVDKGSSEESFAAPNTVAENSSVQGTVDEGIITIEKVLAFNVEAGEPLAQANVTRPDEQYKKPSDGGSIISMEKTNPEAVQRLRVVANENPETESSSPTTPPKPPKASFNVDAKPFSPVSHSDPIMQGALGGDSSGLGIGIVPWASQSFVPLPHMSPTVPTGVGHIPYGTTPSIPSATVRKENTSGKEALSAYAKPWSPHPEVPITPNPLPENEVAIHPASWSSTTVEGKAVMTPSPMVPKETSNNLFEHSFVIHPKGSKTVELELYNYACARCTLRTLYGRLSSRQPDVTMRNVSVDIPPLCVAHLVEQISKAKVTALYLNEVDVPHYDIWLEKPNLSSQLIETMSDCVWTTPMHHGVAVCGRNGEGKRYLENYIAKLKESKPMGTTVYDAALVEVKEHKTFN